jgi:hypothetical protein
MERNVEWDNTIIIHDKEGFADSYGLFGSIQ